MRIAVRYFASVRERVRTAGEEVSLETGATVADLWAALCGAHPELTEVGASMSFAVNQEYAERGRALADGDEVAVIPPVSGGT
jgi:molybdopterin converting factor subunit 1